MAHLVVRAPGRVAFAHLVGERCAIGRGDDNDLVLADKEVSRQHARLVAGDGKHVLHDAGSRHGTFVNEARVSERALADGDVIQVGGVLLVYSTSPDDDAPVLDSLTAAAAPRAVDDGSRRLRALYDLGLAIAGASETAELAARILDGGMQALGAAVGVLELAGARRVARGPGGDTLVLGRSLRAALLGRLEVALVSDGLHGSAVAAPLLVQGRSLGFLYLGRGGPGRPYGSVERDFVHVYAQLAAAALVGVERQVTLARVTEALREAQPSLELLGESPPMVALRDRLHRFAAARDTAVLIRGESGTGKELVARLLHARSPRAGQPFVAVNCAAIPESLIESELFGHERGAFTGAERTRRGRFALAHGGTLFLDEVGDLSLAAQAKVLRAIQEGEIEPVGAEGPVQVDVRVVSATHKPLEDDIAAGRFRADLFYRLSVVDLALPPLRARGADVALLAGVFLERAAARLGRPATGFTAGALAALRAYSWPGNVRQLANEVERALLLSDGPLVELADLQARLEPPVVAATVYDGAERELVARVFRENGGNIRATARALGVSRGRVYRKLVKYQLIPDDALE